jgi:hypothetical protein
MKKRTEDYFKRAAKGQVIKKDRLVEFNLNEDVPECYLLHSQNLRDDQQVRVDKCHLLAYNRAKEIHGDIYTTISFQHSVAVKDNLVYDDVLGEVMDFDKYQNMMPQLVKQNFKKFEEMLEKSKQLQVKK